MIADMCRLIAVTHMELGVFSKQEKIAFRSTRESYLHGSMLFVPTIQVQVIILHFWKVLNRLNEQKATESVSNNKLCLYDSHVPENFVHSLDITSVTFGLFMSY